jgi:HPt (histidine-containing phosphotransfer) domain-containing protein
MALAGIRSNEIPHPFGKAGFEVSPVDLVHLARQTLGDRTLEQQLLDLFDVQAAQIAEKLKTAEAGAASADLAHKLKGSARAVGANDVAGAAENYEYAARAGFLRQSDVDRLIAAVAKARAFLRELAA